MTRRPLALLLALALLAAGACGSDDPATGADAAPTSTTAPADVPQRIVSLSASLTELLYAVGAGDQVVAVDQYSDHPAGVPTTDLSGFRPNVEAIAGYEPDLVVAANDRDGLVVALDGLGIEAVVLPSPDGLDGLYEQAEALGAATGHPDEAAALVAGMRADLAELAASVPEREAPLRYYLELSPDLHSVTSDTFVGDVLALAGLASIADGVDPAAGGYPQLSTESVLAADPDVIFLAHPDDTGQDPAELAGRDGWGDLHAVASDGVVVLDPDLSSRWGPRVVDLLRAVVAATAEREPGPGPR